MKSETKTASVIFEGSVPGLNARLLEKFLAQACRAAQIHGHVSVLITNNHKMVLLNRRFRANNSATDVLSFPAAGNGCSGDIAVSVDIAARNAKALGHSVAEEVRILILHGILHLAGYDHENDHGEMKKIETALRERLGLPTGLIERNSTEEALRVVGRLSLPRRVTRSSSRLRRRRTTYDK